MASSRSAFVGLRAALVSLLLAVSVLDVSAQGSGSAASAPLVVEYEIGSFTSAVSLSVNSAGELVVLDAGADACVRLSIDGKELSRVQGRGWGTAEFDSPTDVCATFPLAVFVADGKNRRVQQFDKELHYVQTISADAQASTLQTGEDQLIAQSFRPIASTESAQGELFVIDADGNRIVKFTTRLQAEREFGTYASGDGRLHMPSDLCMTEDGRVAVSDGSRIVFFDQFGNYLSTRTVDSAITLRAVSSSMGEVIAVGSTSITITGDGSATQQRSMSIDTSMIIGARVEEIRDAARTRDWWYVLTPKTILACRRSTE